MPISALWLIHSTHCGWHLPSLQAFCRHSLAPEPGTQYGRDEEDLERDSSPAALCPGIHARRGDPPPSFPPSSAELETTFYLYRRGQERNGKPRCLDIKPCHNIYLTLEPFLGRKILTLELHHCLGWGRQILSEPLFRQLLHFGRNTFMGLD